MMPEEIEVNGGDYEDTRQFMFTHNETGKTIILEVEFNIINYNPESDFDIMEEMFELAQQQLDIHLGYDSSQDWYIEEILL